MNSNLYFVFALLVFVQALPRQAIGQLENLSFIVAEQGVSDAVYDTTRNLIYGSVSFNSDSEYANSIVSIDPSTGEVVDSVYVGESPNQLAISSDNSRLYIGIDREYGFRWWQPGDGQLGELVELRTGSSSYPLATAVDIAVQPGNARGVAVAIKGVGTSHNSVVVSNDNGSLQYNLSRNSNTIDFAGPFTLITANNQSSGAGMLRMGLLGLQLTGEQSTHLGGGFNTEIEVGRDNRIYNDNGLVYAASPFEELGRLSPSVPYNQSSSLVEAVPEFNVIYSVGANQERPLFGPSVVRLAVFNSFTYNEIDSVELDGVVLEARKGGNLIVAGRDRLALIAGGDLTIISGISVFLPQPFQLGDMNLSGRINFFDIAPFINVLMSGTYFQKADINEDGSVDFLDIRPFASLLQ